MSEQQKISYPELEAEIKQRGLRFSRSKLAIAVGCAVEEAENKGEEMTPNSLRPLIHAQYERLIQEQ